MCKPEKIADGAESVREAPSIHRRSQRLNIFKTSLSRILHKDLDVTPYKVQLFQELRPIDHSMRFLFAKWFRLRLTTEDPDFGKKKIIFSEVAHFGLSGYVNKQNCRIWGTEN